MGVDRSHIKGDAMSGSARLRVAVIFGGKSTEHEVSIQSARNVVKAIDRSRFDVQLIGIDKGGRWVMGQESELLLSEGNPHQALLDGSGAEVGLHPGPGQRELRVLASGKSLGAVDVVFPVLHGGAGEDGSVQGFLKLAGLAYVGPSVLGSAVGMDKDVAKRLMRDAGLPVVPYVCLQGKNAKPMPQDLERLLGFPCFVKPANSGSSVGVSKVHGREELDGAIREAFRFDRKVLVEKAIVGREIEVAVLGNEDPQASVAGEILPQAEFYSYEAKYLDENGAILKIPAELSKGEMDQVRDLAKRAFSCLGCEGMARVDFFLDAKGNFYVNEINTIPGFTAISMYPKLWEASGLGYTELISRLIDLALERKALEDGLISSYS